MYNINCIFITEGQKKERVPQFSTWKLQASPLHATLSTPVLSLGEYVEHPVIKSVCWEIMKTKVTVHTAEEVSSKCQNNQLEGEKFADIDSFLGLHEAK